MTGPDMRVELCGVELKNPVVTASGTFGFGHEYASLYDLSRLGGIGTKGLTPLPREGNRAPRIAETPMGILNSVGLQNPGADAFIREEMPYLRQFDTKIIANVAGNTVEEYCGIVEKVSDAGVDLIEMNISCPNVKAGGMAFGTSCAMVGEVVAAAKKHAGRPLIVKLSPNVADVAEIARAAEAAGADGLSLINTILGMKIDVHTRRPILYQKMGGLSGRAVHPVAVRMVYQVAKAVKIPLIGMGGVATAEDAVELMLAGATAVAVGSACFADPFAPLKIIDGLAQYCAAHHVAAVRDLTGAVQD